MRLWHILFNLTLAAPFAFAALDYFLYVRRARFASRRTRLAWAAVLLACCAKFSLFQFLGGNVFAPDLPEPFIWTLNLMQASVFTLAFAALALRFLPRRAFVPVVPAVAVGAAALGVWNGLRPPLVREIALDFDNLPRTLEGYRIAQISDLHVSSSVRGWRTRKIVDAANAAGADLICLTGDYADGFVADRADDVRPLLDLRAPDGVWYVTGNHEFYRDAENWRAWYRTNGCAFLENRCVFPHPGLALAGLDAGPGRFGEKFDPDPTPLFADATNGELKVVLYHYPRTGATNLLARGVDLQLAGHTHGGIMPVISTFVRRLNNGFVSGLYPIGRGYLYVSPGTGQWAGLPLRYFNPSEITVFTLRGRKRETP